MSDEKKPGPQLEVLLQQLAGEGLSPAQWQELNQLLLTSAEARREYLRFQYLNARLATLAWVPAQHPPFPVNPAAGPSSEPAEAELQKLIEKFHALEESNAVTQARSASEGVSPSPTRSVSEVSPPSISIPHSAFPIFLRSTAAVAFHPVALFSLVGLVAVGLLATLFWPEGPTAIVQGPNGPVATVRLTANAQWEEGFAPQGTALTKRERLKLQRGLAQIVFESRATVILEGPAELQITDRNACRLDQGKLTATVPHEAAGFMVHTPERTVTDLGTEFGVVVRSQGAGVRGQGSGETKLTSTTEVHVFNGKVDLGGSSAPQSTIRNPPSTILSAGSAVRIDAADGIQPIALDTQQFRRKMAFDLIADLRADYDRAAATFVAGQSSDGKITDTIGSGTWNFYSSKTARPETNPTPLVYSTTARRVRNPNAFAQPGNKDGGLDLPGVSNAQLIADDAPPGSGDLSVHPGMENSDAPLLIARWTAGVETTVRIAGHIYDAGSVRDGVTLEIVLNGKTSIWKPQVTSGNSLLTFELNQQVRPGDFIDFVIGPNIIFHADCSNLSVRILPAEIAAEAPVVRNSEPVGPAAGSLLADLRADYDQAAAKFADGQTSEGKIDDASGTGTWNFLSSADGGSQTPLTYTTQGKKLHNANSFTQVKYTDGSGRDLPGVSRDMLIVQDARAGQDELSVHPGSPESPEPLLVTRWTSGVKAIAKIRGAIQDVGSSGDGITLLILLNGKKSIFDTQTSQGNTPIDFDLTQAVAPGDTIDFVVGPNVNFYGDSSNLRIRISR